MKIALYYPWIYLKGGIEKVILETIKRSRHEWVIFTNHYCPETTFTEFADFKINEFKKVPVDRGFFSVFKAALTVYKQKINLDVYDILFVHSDGVGDFITFRNHAKPALCFCHTPLRIFFDPYYRQGYLKGKSFLKRVLLKLFSLPFKFIDRLAWKNYGHVFVNSREVLGRVVKGGLASEQKIQVLHPGIDFFGMRPSFVYNKYFLVPGRIMWTKNIELAINAFIEFCKSPGADKEFKLVVAGSVHPKNKDYLQKLQELSKREEARIIFKVNISDQEYYQLYDKSYAVLFTAFNEDWGIIPLEAMTFAKPVIAVNRGGPKESVRDNENGFLVSASPVEFAAKMLKLASDEQLVRRMGEAGRANAMVYDWGEFVKTIDDYIDTVVKTNN